MNFLKRSSSQTVDEVASNVIRIVNYTSKSYDLALSFNYTADWKFIGKDIKLIQLKSMDSIFFPVRIIPSKNSQGNTNYIVNAFLSSQDGIQIANSIWYIAIEKISAWSAVVPTKKVYFTNNSDSTNFEVRLQNLGNSDENIIITLFPDKELSLFDFNTDIPNQFSTKIYLPVGFDTIIKYSIRRNPENLLPTENNYIDKHRTDKHSVKVLATNENKSLVKSKSWKGNIDFFKLPNEYVYSSNNYSSVPLIFDFNTYNLMSNSTYATLDIHGNTNLPKDRTISYYYQANYNQNYLKARTFLGNYHYFGYGSKNLNVELGNVGASRGGLNLSGKGIKTSFRVKKHWIGGMYMRSPDFTEDKLTGYSVNHSYNSKNFKFGTSFQKKLDKISKVNIDLLNTNLNFRIKQSHNIGLDLGYSQEEHYWNPAKKLNLSGYTYALNYSGSIKKFRYFARYQSSTDKYSVYRGMNSMAGNLNYNLSKNNNLAVSYNYFNYEPLLYYHGELLNNKISTEKTTYSLKYIRTSGNSNFIVNPIMHNVNSQSVSAITRGMNLEYRYRKTRDFVFYTTVFGGFTKVPDYTLPDFFISQLRGTIKYKMLSANARYYYGPYYTQEILKFVSDSINPQKIYTSLYHDYWFNSNKCLVKTTLSYNYTQLYKRNMFNLRPEFFYFSKSGYRFSIYSRVLLMSESEFQRQNQGYIEVPNETKTTKKIEFGIGLRKEIGFPISFKKFFDIDVVVYRDMNGNGKQDQNEDGIGNMLIMVKYQDTIKPENSIDMADLEKGFELVTNSRGQAVFTNIPLGEYVITAYPLASMGGWFDGRTFNYTIDKDRTLYIPLNKGAKVSGGIILERDKFSSFKDVNLSNIRVTAVSSKGQTFSTLTDIQGKFSMFLPNGNFTIMINESALGSKFEFLQNNIYLELTDDFENYSISFYVIEKKRKLQVTKFNGDGDVETKSEEINVN
ncbi:MAG: hypothetical protein K9J13_17210, partial [Saprospiraceae bacterium]|nr:hypothetical protein [Saprospiraceae bacterium]